MCGSNTANINTAEERTVEQYGQLPPVLRSEQVSEEITPQADAAGVRSTGDQPAGAGCSSR